MLRLAPLVLVVAACGSFAKAAETTDASIASDGGALVGDASPAACLSVKPACGGEITPVSFTAPASDPANLKPEYLPACPGTVRLSIPKPPDKGMTAYYTYPFEKPLEHFHVHQRITGPAQNSNNHLGFGCGVYATTVAGGIAEVNLELNSHSGVTTYELAGRGDDGESLTGTQFKMTAPSTNTPRDLDLDVMFTKAASTDEITLVAVGTIDGMDPQTSPRVPVSAAVQSIELRCGLLKVTEDEQETFALSIQNMTVEACK